MARIFITGSTSGLGLRSGEQLLSAGHEVIFHARNASRAAELKHRLGVKASIVEGDLETIAGAIRAAEQVNALGPFDGVIHNAGIMPDGPRTLTSDRIPSIFAVNVLAPYILTASIASARRQVYLSSSMHRVAPHIDDALWSSRTWNSTQAYSESKLLVTALTFAFARRWPAVAFNAVDPGWVPTRMGGSGAPDDIDAGAETQALLAAGDNRFDGVTGKYLHHMSIQSAASAASDEDLQERLIGLCRELSKVSLPH